MSIKKIGREVLFMHVNDEFSRNGEGAFIRLKNGDILYAYTKYPAGDWADRAEADIYGIYSSDEGETWHGDRKLLERRNGEINYMSVSFLRMKNGDIGMFYLINDEKAVGRLHLSTSADEGITWSEPVCCITEEGDHVTNNDRVVRLKNGRIVVPANRHPYGAVENWVGFMMFYASDDDGKTWFKMTDRVGIAELKGSTAGLQESGIYEYEEGGLWAWSRTDRGYQYECFSDDLGKSWTEPVPNLYFSSHVSPMQVKKVGKYTLAVFNPIPGYTSRDEQKEPWGRTPYLCAVSEDDGKTFLRTYYLEDDFTNGYCYPSLIECEDGFLVAYYHSDGSEICLRSQKITKVLWKEIE